MTKEEFLNLAAASYDRCVETLRKKNNDYARTDNAFNNFDLVERLGITDRDTGILVRLSDKLARIINLRRKDHTIMVMDEKLEDTILDAINYLFILYASIYEKSMDVSKDTVESDE